MTAWRSGATTRITHWQGVRQVAGREIRERIRSRLFRVATLISALIVAAIIVVPTLRDTGTPVYDVGLVGPTTPALVGAIEGVGGAVGGEIVTKPVASVAEAERLLRDGGLDVALIDGRSIVVDDPIDQNRISGRLRLVVAVSEAARFQAALEASGLGPDDAAAASAQRQLPIRSLGEPRPSDDDQLGAFIGVVVLFLFLQQYGSWILVGVAEEKSSRIAEVLLATLRPRQLVAGKVIGIGAVGCVQATVVAVTALVATNVVGADLVGRLDPLTMVAAVGWFVLGFSFYGWAYAAAGSLVSRQSEAQAAGFPISVPLLAAYIAASTALTSAEPSAVLQVLAYLPPTAPLCMPTLIGMGRATPGGVALAAAGVVVSAYLMSRVAGAVYSNAILRTGKKVKWLEALRSS